MTTQEATARMRDGVIRGVLDRDGIAEFRGLAYASRPEWQAPVRIGSATSPRDPSRFGPVPPQPGVVESETGPGSYLTVTVRAPWPDDRPRPVLVWLCVGGNIVGRNDVPPYTTSALPVDGVVLVTVTSRLGAAGFAVVEDAPDNRAVMDWIAALEWVRDEISAFGGDPGSVTLGGQSAGGGAVTALLTSSRAAGLFHRAIIMSTATPSMARAPAAAATAAFAARLGVDATAAGIGSLPYARLIEETAATFGPRWRVDDPVVRVRHMIEGPPFRIVEDPVLDLSATLPALRAGAGSGIPVLMGSAAEEFTDAFGLMSDALDDVTLARAFDEISPGGSRQLAEYRHRLPSASPGQLLGQAFTDANFRRTPLRAAAARATAEASTFLYEVGPFAEGPSARHGVDVAPALGSASPDGVDASIARSISAAWSRFIVSGSPGWEPWRDSHAVQRFGDASRSGGEQLDQIESLWNEGDR